jgi:site-specific DNA recombinase
MEEIMQSKSELATGRPTAVYVRDAAVQQDQSSLEAQVESCVRQATEDGSPAVSDAHVFRDQQSGRDLDRPGLNKLRTAVQAGEVGVLYIHSVGRLSRSFAHFVLLYEEFAAVGVEIRFVGGSFDNNLGDRLSGLVAS